MARLSVFLVCLLCASLCHATINGQGNMTVGLSVDDKDVHEGLSLDYIAQSDSPLQAWNTNVSLDYSTAKNRPSAINGHEYLYGDSSINTGIDHIFKTALPHLVWSSEVSYSQEGDRNADGSVNYRWNTLSGPVLNKKIRSDIELVLNVKKGREYSNERYRSDSYRDLRLLKKFGHTSTLESSLEQNCWNYQSAEITDGCQDSVDISYSYRTARSVQSVTFGVLKTDETKEVTYGFNITYNLNRTDTIAINIEKERSDLSETMQLVDGRVVNIFPETVIKRHSLAYNRQFKRSTLAINHSQIKYEEDSGEQLEKESSLLSSYLLGSRSCPTCSIEFQYLKNERTINGWTTTSLGIRYPLKRYWNALISLRRTAQDTGARVMSLNLQLSYDGRSTLISR